MLQRYKIIHNSLFIINNFFVLLWLKFKNNSYFMDKKLRTGSLCVHAGYKAKNGEPIELPIIQSTTFKYDDSDEMAQLFDLKKEGYFYTRLQNPTNCHTGRRCRLCTDVLRTGSELLRRVQYLSGWRPFHYL